MDAIVFIIGLAIAAVVLVGIGVMIASFYKKVDQGQALIVNMMRGEPIVTFTGHIVYPIIHRAETMEISVKTIELSRRGNDGLICKDNIRADIKVSFYVRVNKTQEDVLKVAQAIGCARASDQKTLEELFVAKFSEALKTVGKRLDFVELYTQRDDFKDQLIEVIGRDLNGYILDDAAIDYLEQTPLELLDKENILDSQGIRKITKITSEQNMATNDLRQTERKELSRQNLEADEAILELEKRKADAVAKQQREISNVQAREKAEIDRVAAEEHRKAQLARIQAAEQIQLGEVNKSRQLEVAEKDKERVVAIKHEQVCTPALYPYSVPRPSTPAPHAQPGDEFPPHFDNSTTKTASLTSLYSVLIYLTEDFDGGATSFFNEKTRAYIQCSVAQLPHFELKIQGQQ